MQDQANINNGKTGQIHTRKGSEGQEASLGHDKTSDSPSSTRIFFKSTLGEGLSGRSGLPLHPGDFDSIFTGTLNLNLQQNGQQVAGI